jgi:hypothetical protein
MLLHNVIALSSRLLHHARVVLQVVLLLVQDSLSHYQQALRKLVSLQVYDALN